MEQLYVNLSQFDLIFHELMNVESDDLVVRYISIR